MLDGGIVDSIPLQRAMDEGYASHVVVLTRNKGYRKETKDIKGCLRLFIENILEFVRLSIIVRFVIISN